MFRADNTSGNRNGNTGQHVGDLTYSTALDCRQRMAIYDSLPASVRKRIQDMPLRANVAKYAKLVRFQGEQAALEAADAAVKRFHEAVERERAAVMADFQA